MTYTLIFYKNVLFASSRLFFTVDAAPSPAKYSFTSFTTTPESKNTAIRFGMTIRPLKVSAMLHISPRFIVAPTIATSEYTTMNGLFALVPNKNSMHLVP